MKIYSIYDKKALTYSPLICMPNDVTAIRMVQMEIARGGTPMAFAPFDFCLVRLGELDETTGKITTLEIGENVFECANAVQEPEK